MLERRGLPCSYRSISLNHPRTKIRGHLGFLFQAHGKCCQSRETFLSHRYHSFRANARHSITAEFFNRHRCLVTGRKQAWCRSTTSKGQSEPRSIRSVGSAAPLDPKVLFDLPHQFLKVPPVLGEFSFRQLTEEWVLCLGLLW